jgi:hypothetical protein
MSSTNQDFHTQIRSKPSHYKHQLRKLSASGGAVANYVGSTYPYVIDMLNGVYPMTERTEAKNKELIQLVETNQI